jgi:type I restriction enzyme M protein
MLDNVTKKNIDDCRDVLVGKVPDPKSQIEQITLALIYKFMDDMDKEAVEKLKGKAKFFTGEFAKYGWRKLFDPSLGGKEMLDLYSEALDNLQTNGNIPELFRNIFKNAYLPYKDPSTLKMFLKHINEFEYSHSEKLGDAFEYLLSVMGSQGDAGQFRTPRHVIDFIAACLDPKKNETVADPACGTAGFLLSAYKHILKQNTDKRLGDKLTPDQRKKIAENFVGYDISPDMVRLSLVNMYLHGFATPKIHEYDTLSSEDRWNETFDVILANPPFMTPKGGIRPHKKFGVQANKAEVLFTDYIAEHLNKNGRAGIVVPNGIVATTQTAYKQLRKLLVEDSLIAVISLPAGCFNPYSGVKTSILMLDKVLAKKSDHILFIKVNNDGYDLGAQRREVDKNDLPTALQAFSDFKKHISEGRTFEPDSYNSLCLLVEKEKVLANKDVVLSGDRYVEGKTYDNSNWSFTSLKGISISMHQGINTAGDKVEFEMEGYPILQSRNITSGTLDFKNMKYMGSSDWLKYESKYRPQFGDVLLTNIGTIGKSIVVTKEICEKEFLIHWNIFKITCDLNIVNPYYLKYCFDKLADDNYYAQFQKGGTVSFITKKVMEDIQIPLPPIEIQEQIVKEIEGYQKIIDGAKMVVGNYKPTISINPEWEMVELGDEEYFTTESGGTPDSENKDYWNGNLNWATLADLPAEDFVTSLSNTTRKITDLGLKKSSAKLLPPNSILISSRATIGRVAVNQVPMCTNQGFKNIIIKDFTKVNAMYLAYYAKSLEKHLNEIGGGSTFKEFSKASLKEIQIPVPTIEEQTQIVHRIEQEQALVNANKQLISIFEQKIKDRINEVWGVKEAI